MHSIVPDITCFGKIIGGGFPAAAFGGSREIMDTLAPIGTVFQAGTLSGNPIAMEAGYQTLSLIDENTYQELEHKTNLITEPVRSYLKEKKIPACIQQVGSMFTLFFGRTKVESFAEALFCNQPLFAKFFRHMLKEGIFIPPSQFEAWFVSMVHTEDHLLQTRDSILKFFYDL